MYVLDVSTESAKFVLGESISSDATNIQVICNIENGCFDQGAVTIVDPMGHAPEIFFQRRSAPNAATSGLWRHFTAAIENAEGRKPVFKISRQYRDGASIYDLVQWRGVQTTDFVSWSQSNTPSLEGGASGTFNFDFSTPLPAGRSYIAHNVYGRQAEADAFAQWLLTDNAAVAAPADPSYINGVFANSVAENNDLGDPVGDNPRYAIKLAFGGSTTDGNRKRKLVVMYGIHAAGEGQAWWAFVEGIKWLMTSIDTQAQNMRANWDVWLYFNVNPNGIRGGTSRTTPRSTTDPNRNWSSLGSVSSLEEIDTLKRVIHSDVGGQCDTLFSFHGDVYSTNKFQTWVWTDDYNAGTRSPAMQAILDAGQTIWGVAPTLSTSSTNNTDVWFGRQVLNAPISLDSETPSMAGSTTQYFAEIGQNWYKSLEVVDQAGVILQDVAHELTAPSFSQANSASSGAIAQAHILSGSASTQGNDINDVSITQIHLSSINSATQTNTVGSVEVSQVHVLSAPSIIQAQSVTSVTISRDAVHSLATAPIGQENTASEKAIEQTHNIAASNVVQLNASPDNSVAQSHTLVTIGITQTNISSSGIVARGVLLVTVPIAQNNVVEAAKAVQEHILTTSEITQGNIASAGEISTAHDLAVGSVTQLNVSSSKGISLTQILIIASAIQNNSVTHGAIVARDGPVLVIDSKYIAYAYYKNYTAKYGA